MLSDLIRAVAKIRHDLPQRIRRDPDEARTKTHLIHPILHALGWTVGEAPRVRRDFRLRNDKKRTVDYALMDKTGTPRVFIQTKRLNITKYGKIALHKEVRSYLKQMGKPAAEKLACLVLTNGREWCFCPISFRRGRAYYDDWQLTVDLAQEYAESCAESLNLLLSESRICAGRAKQQLTMEFNRYRMAREWQRMRTQPDQKLVKLLQRQRVLKDYGISREEAAYAILHPQQTMPGDRASADMDGAAPPPKKSGLHRRKSRSRLRVKVGKRKFDSVQFRGVNKMLPKVLRAIMEFKNVSGEQLMQACLDARITVVHSRTWIIQTDKLAELYSSPSKVVRMVARSAQAIDKDKQFFVIAYAHTWHHARRLQKLGLMLDLGDDLQVNCTLGTMAPDPTD